MSGPVANNIFRSSGVIAAAAGGLSWQPVVTASTLTAEAGNGYWINTTSNTCTITLPASAEAGDQIIFADYARTWGTNKIIIDSNGLNYQGDPDTFTLEYDTSGQTVSIVYSGATVGWIPEDDDTVADVPVYPPTQKAIMAFGNAGGGTGRVSLSNLVSSSGVVAADVTGVGTARDGPAAESYGFDKAIFAYGYNGSSEVSMSNLVSNSGVVATDTTGVGTVRWLLAASGYGGDKAIFGYGLASSATNLSNLVSSSGVVATDTAGVGTARRSIAACGYGGDKGIFGYGTGLSNTTNLVTNAGVVGTDVTGVGSARKGLDAAKYGTDKGIFAYGSSGSVVSLNNLVSNSGVVAADVTGVGTARETPGA